MNETQNPQTFIAWTQATTFRKNITTIIFTFLALAIIAKTVLIFKQADQVGKADSYAQSISVTGQYDMYAKPDTLRFNINVNEDGKDVGEATTKATDKIKKAMDILIANGVEEKNIKTTNWSTTDRYESVSTPCSESAPMSISNVGSRTIQAVVPCTNTSSKIVGSTVYQTLEVKIQDIEKNATLEKRGKIVGELASANIKTDGFEFTVFDIDAVKDQARKEAIKKAKANAKILAKDLGVSLKEIVGFSEQNDGGYRPYMSAKADMAVMESADIYVPSPQITAGEKKITSIVSITYLLK